jgi:hypothetical protein
LVPPIGSRITLIMSCSPGQLHVALSRVRSPNDLCTLLPPDMGNFTIRPPVDMNVGTIIETLNRSGPPPTAPVLAPDKINPLFLPSIPPTGRQGVNSLTLITISMLPTINLIIVHYSTLMINKSLIHIRLRYPSALRPCHGSLPTNRSFDSIALELSFPDVLSLSQQVSIM